MRKKFFIFGIICLSLLSTLSLTASAATTPTIDTNSGYFLLSLSTTPHLTSSNSSGVGYAIYNDIVQQGSATDDNQYNNWCLQSLIVKYDTSSTSTSYGDYSYVPLSVSEYMNIPSIDGSVYTYPNMALLNASDWWQFSFSGAYSHCRAAISIDNYRNLVVLYNSNFFQSYDDFLTHYNAQDIHDKTSFIGLLYLKTFNPDHDGGSYHDGYSHGYTDGYEAGTLESTTPLGLLFSGVNSILDINLFGTISLGTIVYAFLGIGFLFMVIKMFSKG